MHTWIHAYIYTYMRRQNGRQGGGTQHRGSAQQNNKHKVPERECAERTENVDLRKFKYSMKSICYNTSNIERRNKPKKNIHSGKPKL